MKVLIPLLVIAALLFFSITSERSVTGVSQTSCTPAPTGLLAWWPGDGDATDPVDGNHGTPQNGATFMPGLVGDAFSFDGVDDVVTVSNAPSLNFDPNSPMTVELWAYRTGLASVMHLVGKRTGCGFNDFNYQMAFDPSHGLLFGGDPINSPVTTGQQMPLNTWMHLAGTFDGTTLRFYINGVLAGTSTGTLGPINNASLEIGNSGACEPFAGLIDEVSFYDRALSASEIQDIFNAGSAGKCRATPTPTPTPTATPTPTPTSTNCVQSPPGAISWWPLDETSGSVAADRVGDHPGAYANDPVPAPGEVRGALRFDGSNYVAVADSDQWAFGTNDFTIDLWANWDVPGSGSIGEPGDIFIGSDEGPGNRNKWFFALGGGVLDFTALNVDSPSSNIFLVRAPFSPIVGQWYHLAVTKRGTLFTIFVNGAAVGSEISTSPIANANAPLTIGQAENIGFMNGRLDEIAIYNRALTGEELKAIYDAGSAGKCINLAIRPDRGGDTGSVSVGINGSGFVQGATVKLKKVGQTDIAGKPAIVSDAGTTINTTFDLTGNVQGLWDLVVTNPDNTDFILPGAFTIEAGATPSIWTDIIGLGLIRIAQDQNYYVALGNSGNVDANNVSVIIGIPRTVPTTCSLPGTTDVFHYEPGGPIIGVDPNFLFVQVHAGPIGPLQTKTIQCKLRATNTNNIVFPAYAFEDARILRATTYALSFSNSALSVSDGIELATRPSQLSSRARLVIIDGLGDLPPDRKTGKKRVARVTHPYLIIDDKVYARDTIPSPSCSGKDCGGLRGFTLDEFFNIQSQIDSCRCIESSEGRIPFIEPPPPTSLRTIVELDNTLFPNLDIDRLKADMERAANNPMPTPSRDCIQTLNDISASSGLDLLPSGSGNTGNEYQNGDDFYRRLGLDPFSFPSAKCRKDGTAFQNTPDCSGGGGLPFIQKILQVIFSFDPNDKVGSQGSGEAHFLPEEPLRYSIFFENLETATAPAQEVLITDQLDTANMDLSTLSLGPIAFGNKQVIPPPGASAFATDVDLRPDKGLIVRITASLNPNTGLLTWRFTSIHPATGNPPEDPLSGFLPPNVNPPEGDGSVFFTVMPKKGLATETEIRNKARIIFDVNEPIDTPEWFNTIDNSKPASNVLPLTASQCASNVQVQWAGTDEGSGIASYNIYVSDNGAPFTVWQQNTTATSGTYTGQFGHTYAFYSVAQDKTGNLEDVPANPDATVTLSAPAPPTFTSVPPAVTANTGQGATVCGAFVSDPILGTATAQSACSAVNVTRSGVPSGNIFPVGQTTITYTAIDASGNSVTATQTVTVIDNTPPTIATQSASLASLWPPNHTMRDVLVNYTDIDNCLSTCTLSVTSNEPLNGTGDGDTAPDWEIVDPHHVRLRAERAAIGNGRTYTITVTCTDGAGNSTSKDVAVFVTHNIAGPASGAAFKIGTTVNFSGTFWDLPGRKHTAQWVFDDVLATTGKVVEPSGSKSGTVTSTYTFTTPGVYKIKLRVSDNTGQTSWVDTAGDIEAIVIIYDPNGGYTVGGGYITTYAGSYWADPNKSGKLSFGFNSKYTNATNPKGETQIQFAVGSLEFNALNYDYLAISGARAQFRGFGKLNGESGYNFILTVIDGQLTGGGGVDKFRIKIWNKTTGMIVFDSQMGESDAVDPSTPVGPGSSIVIQK